ncbi:MAG TPA: ComEC/Rec2 family competence protein [Ferruginibacter sp.]|nr:ComEC/Rec2 family competence protein [Ferruginibacter sp.]
MSPAFGIPIWKKAPFTRLILPFIAGIILQWYLQFSLPVILASLLSFTLSSGLFFLLPLSLRFKLQPLQGFVLHLLLAAVGLLISWQKDMRYHTNWYGNFYRQGDHLLVRIDEPLVEKSRSFKAEGCVEAIIQDDTMIACKGKLLLYFSKDSFGHNLQYGDMVLIQKDLQAIKNSGNPGAFNYQRYAAFQQLFHNVFLKKKDWVKAATQHSSKNRFRQFIFDAREYVLSVLQRTIAAGNSGKDELGIAEALLIGYTNDLDKDLVQAYSNTGVVHIIAISGMHLGLIYVLLLWFFAKIPLIKRSKWMQTILILACLWVFSLLTGGSASVIRSAVMFTFITLGKTVFNRPASVYSSLAASAFVMLCYDPYYLWDVGFQLSYLAVIGIVVFQKPIYNIFYIKNKFIDKTWQLMAVSLAAQLLTFPVCIYYFHQFPNLFLLTNLIAVPLSAVILYAEIALVALSWLPIISDWLGKLVSALVWTMNKTILYINEFSFAVCDRIPANVLSTWLLYVVVIGFSFWLMSKNKNPFRFGLMSLLAFSVLMAYNKWTVMKQQKIIVYNVPRQQAIDLVSGSDYQFVGDSVLLQNGLLQNFHLKPGRIALQLAKRKDLLNTVFSNGMFYQFNNTRLAIIDRYIQTELPVQKIRLDILIISKNPKLTISQLTMMFHCDQYVFDASNPAWKIEKWLEECRTLNVQGHSIPGQGAFVLDVGM